MLIVSKFHDYYDSALATGVDKTIVYERTPYEMLLPDFLKLYLGEHAIAYNDYGRYRVVGFCGQLHIAVTNTKLPKKFTTMHYDSSSEHYYDVQSMEASDTVDQEWLHGAPRTYLTPRVPRIKRFERAITNPPQAAEWFHENKVVCFVTERSVDPRLGTVVRVNPCLKDYQFYKVKDPFTAVQDIMMFVSGVLGSPNRPMVAISDKDRIVGHGFDLKTSFRRSPTKQRRKP